MWKYIIIIIAALIIFSQLDATTQSKLLNVGSLIKTKAQETLNQGAYEEYKDDQNRTIMGPVYQEVPCHSDLECQEWYKCSGCYCDTNLGKCWY